MNAVHLSRLNLFMGLTRRSCALDELVYTMKNPSDIHKEQSFAAETLKWYALHTKHRHEKKVNQRLLDKGIQSFLPLNTLFKKWSDRYKEIQEPLFSCYVFVKIDLRQRLSVLQTDGAVTLVSFSGIPASIPDDQIEALEKIVEKTRNIDYAEYMPPGSRVKVTQGPLQDIEGILVRTKNENRLIISIDGIRQAISVEIDPRDVKLIEKNHNPANTDTTN